MEAWDQEYVNMEVTGHFTFNKDGKAALDVRLEGETLWLNLNKMAGLFERDKSVISRRLRNVYKTGELGRVATVAFFATTAGVKTMGE